MHQRNGYRDILPSKDLIVAVLLLIVDCGGFLIPVSTQNLGPRPSPLLDGTGQATLMCDPLESVHKISVIQMLCGNNQNFG